MMENKKMRAEHPKKELAVDILYDIIGSILFGAGIYTFAEGGNFAPGWNTHRFRSGNYEFCKICAGEGGRTDT